MRFTRNLSITEMITLRDFQQECLDSIVAEYEAGTSRQIISLPTGSGKTVVMAAVGRHFNKKVLVLAHREELITHSRDKFRLVWPNVEIGVLAGRAKRYLLPSGMWFRSNVQPAAAT